MTVAEAQGNVGSGARAGTQALTLLAAPINVDMLRALAEEPKSLIDLRREVGSPPQTTMRGHLRSLSETGVVTRRRQGKFPGALHYELTSAGHELWRVARILEGWLARAQDGPRPLGSVAARSTIKALVEGWSTNMIRALAARPLSLTDLDSLITRLSYPSLERRLGALRIAGLIRKTEGRGRGTPYLVTDWLRQAITPLGAAAYWERLHAAAKTSPVKRHDIEAAFLLAVPLIRLPSSLSGSCHFAVEVRTANGDQLAGATVVVTEGKISSCVARLDGTPAACAMGSAVSWFAAMTEHDTGRLELSGDPTLPRTLLDGLHEALFGAGLKLQP